MSTLGKRRRRLGRRLAEGPGSGGGAPLAPDAWRRLGACTVAAALLQLDGTVITVALPTVAKELRVSAGLSAAVLSAYFVPYALLLWPGGGLVDRLGARRLALCGLALFGLGALGGALAPSFGLLVAMRVLQGAGAGLVSPAALAGAVSGFPPSRRGSALGIWGAAAGISNLLGPLLGGLLTDLLGWRAVWWALIPLALFAAGAIALALPPRTALEDQPNRAVLRGVVGLATAVAALTFAVMIGSFYLAEQYLQRTVHLNVLAAAAALLLVALLVGLAAPLAGRLSDRFGERLPAFFGFAAAGVGLAILAVPGVSLRSPLTALPLVPVGLGLGLLFVPTSRAALNATPKGLHGRVSAVLSAGRLGGAAVGAGLAGVALAGGPSASRVHLALLCGAAACFALGLPAALRLSGRKEALGQTADLMA